MHTPLAILEQLEFPNFEVRRINDIEDPTSDEHYRAFFAAADSEDFVLMKAYANALKEKYPEHPWPEFLVGWALLEQKKFGSARQRFFNTLDYSKKFRRRVDYCFAKMEALKMVDPWESAVDWCSHLASAEEAENRARQGIEKASELLCATAKR